MNYKKLLEGGKFVVERYILPRLQKQGAKQYVYQRVNEAVDVEDFVQKYIWGIKNANEPEIEVDKEFAARIMKAEEEASEEILSKDVSLWTADDYQFLRRTVDYDKNWVKRKKVLEYLKRGDVTE